LISTPAQIEEKDSIQVEKNAEGMLGRSRIIVLDKAPKIYHDKGLTSQIDISLPPDSEFEIEEVEGANVVRAILPDSKIGFINGDEVIQFIQPSWTRYETRVFDSPEETATHSTLLEKGEEFELLNAVDGTNEQWVRIRLSGGEINYMSGSAVVITQDDLVEGIAELIGDGQDEEKIVSEFAEQGVPERKVRDLFVEVTKLATQYEKSPEGRKELAAKASRQILYGFLWAAGGGIATYIGYNSAGMGDTYLVFYGAIGWGVIDMFRGIAGWLKYSS